MILVIRQCLSNISSFANDQGIVDANLHEITRVYVLFVAVTRVSCVNDQCSVAQQW